MGCRQRHARNSARGPATGTASLLLLPRFQLPRLSWRRGVRRWAQRSVRLRTAGGLTIDAGRGKRLCGAPPRWRDCADGGALTRGCGQLPRACCWVARGRAIGLFVPRVVVTRLAVERGSPYPSQQLSGAVRGEGAFGLQWNWRTRGAALCCPDHGVRTQNGSRRGRPLWYCDGLGGRRPQAEDKLSLARAHGALGTAACTRQGSNTAASMGREKPQGAFRATCGPQMRRARVLWWMRVVVPLGRCAWQFANWHVGQGQRRVSRCRPRRHPTEWNPSPLTLCLRGVLPGTGGPVDR